MKKLLLLLGFTIGLMLNAQSTDQIEKYQATFLFNFTRQIQWPNIHNNPEFVIGVYGKRHPLTTELLAGAGTRNVGGRSIKIVEFSSVAEIGFCHMLFVPAGKISQLNSISDALANSPVVLVTHMEGRTPPESVINLSVVDDKMGFRINEEVAKQRGLMLSAQLVNYSRK